MRARYDEFPERPPNSSLNHLHREHRPGPPSDDQHVVAPASGKQQQRPRRPEAHQTSRLDHPLLCADDLCGPHHPSISLQENAIVHVWIRRVGDNVHMGEQLLQGTHDCSRQVSWNIKLQ